MPEDLCSHNLAFGYCGVNLLLVSTTSVAVLCR